MGLLASIICITITSSQRTCNCTTSCSSDCICNSHKECELEDIHCVNGTDCTVTCSSTASCSEAKVYCPSGYDCTILCAANQLFDICYGITVYAANSNKLTFEGCTSFYSCIDMTVYCPPNLNGDKKCIMVGSDVGFGGNDMSSDPPSSSPLNGFSFYAINGWSDIDTSGYTGTYINHIGTMSCGTNGYNQTCSSLLSNQWRCSPSDHICNAVPTTSSISPTTSAPTSSVPTTQNPTTANPTTLSSIATSSVPTTQIPTSAVPTTSNPTTSIPTTLHPTSSVPTTPNPTTFSPTTFDPTTFNPTTFSPTDADIDSTTSTVVSSHSSAVFISTTTTTTTTSTTMTNSEQDELNSNAQNDDIWIYIVMIAGAIIVLLLCVIGIIVFVLKRKRRKYVEGKKEIETQMNDSNQSTMDIATTELVEKQANINGDGIDDISSDRSDDDELYDTIEDETTNPTPNGLTKEKDASIESNIDCNEEDDLEDMYRNHNIEGASMNMNTTATDTVHVDEKKLISETNSKQHNDTKLTQGMV